MADQIIFEDRWKEQRKARAKRPALIIAGIICVIIAGEAVFQFVLAPNMRIENIIIDNDIPIRREQLLAAAGLQGTPYYFKINVETVKNNLEALPAVKSAYVRKIFPDSLRIVIRGRRPVAVALAETGNGSVPLAFDEDGVVFLSGANVPSQGLPVVSGIRFEAVHVGMRLPDMMKPFLLDLMRLQKSAPALLSAFSEMRIIRKGADRFEIIMYPVYYRVPVRIEGELTGEHCRIILMIMDALRLNGTLDNLEEIDFRTEDIIYRYKGG
jgi:cell division septal protein FtsQ